MAKGLREEKEDIVNNNVFCLPCLPSIPIGLSKESHLNTKAPPKNYYIENLPGLCITAGIFPPSCALVTLQDRVLLRKRQEGPSACNSSIT